MSEVTATATTGTSTTSNDNDVKDVVNANVVNVVTPPTTRRRRKLNVIPWEEGWGEIKAKGIDKLEAMLKEGLKPGQTRLFTPREYIHIYSICYDMCMYPNHWAGELYKHHGQTMEDFLQTHVMPALRKKMLLLNDDNDNKKNDNDNNDDDNKKNESEDVTTTAIPSDNKNSSNNNTNDNSDHVSFLLELRCHWMNHQIMNKWMKRLFTRLERDYIRRGSLPQLCQAGLQSFRTCVYDQVKEEATHALLTVVEQCRHRRTVTANAPSLIQSTLEIYEAMRFLPPQQQDQQQDHQQHQHGSHHGSHRSDTYFTDWEDPFLQASRRYYIETYNTDQHKAWRDRDSSHQQEQQDHDRHSLLHGTDTSTTVDYYLIQVTITLATEYRIADHLHASTKSKLLQMAQEEIVKKVDESFQFVFDFL